MNKIGVQDAAKGGTRHPPGHTRLLSRQPDRRQRGEGKTGASLVNESGESLQEIVESVKKVGDLISKIAAASREQMHGIELVNRAVTQMDEATQQNAAMAEETAAASQNTAQRASHMADLMEFFSTR